MAATFDTSDVQLGYWTNWAHGKVHGSTITRTSRDGALLTAAIAVFVTFAGTRFWKLCTFALHLCLSDEKPQDSVYHQRQAVLRNSSDTFSTTWRLWTVVWAWRKKDRGLWRRVIPFVAGSLLVGLALTAAGIFSSTNLLFYARRGPSEWETLWLGQYCWLKHRTTGVYLWTVHVSNPPASRSASPAVL